MADKIEAEVKISIVRAQIMAEEARQAREIYQRLQQPQQQQEENDRMRLNLQYLLGREVSHTNMTNGLTTLAASMPPISFGKTQIPEVVVALPRKQWSDQGNPHSTVVVAEETRSRILLLSLQLGDGFVVKIILVIQVRTSPWMIARPPPSQ